MRLKVLMGLSALALAAQAFSATLTWNFDADEIGKVPAKFIWESTGEALPLAQFTVVEDVGPKNTAGNKVVKMTKYEAGAAYAENHLCWTKDVSVINGTIEVDNKVTLPAENAYSGGLAWRIKDKNNYYCVRYKTTDSKISAMKVVNGTRTALSPNDATLVWAANTWYHLKVVFQGTSIKVYKGDNLIFEVTDSSLKDGGGVGLFQRGTDNISFWDNLQLTSSEITTNTIKPASFHAAGKVSVSNFHDRVFFDLLGKKNIPQSERTDMLNSKVFISKDGSIEINNRNFR
jgi:hypothetical protein